MTVFRPTITLTPDDVRCVASLRRPGHTGRRINELVPDLLDLVQNKSLLAPQFIYEFQRVHSVVAGKIQLDHLSLQAPLVARKLPRMQRLAIGLCSIGPALGDHVNHLFAQRMGLQALVLDEIGNVAVRKLARRAHAHIRRKARRIDLQASSAISPGSDGFAMDQQGRLCDLVASHRIGVTIQGGQMMQPGKSLSFVIGLGAVMPRWSQAEDCRVCRAADHCRDRVSGQALV